MKAIESEKDGAVLLAGSAKPQVEKIDELLAVLETDIENMKQSLSYLSQMRDFVIKRDDSSLQKLIESIQSKKDSYASNESKRTSIRQELADSLGCGVGEVTLSNLVRISPQTKREQLLEMKAQLLELSEKLKMEHFSVSTFLADCARIN